MGYSKHNAKTQLPSLPQTDNLCIPMSSTNGTSTTLPVDCHSPHLVLVATPESSADSKPRYPGEASTTNMGHTEGKEWPYTIISKELFDSEYQRLGRFGSYANGADSVTFQPHNPVKNQDRLAVQEWDLKNGKWTFAAVFDGKVPCTGS